MYRYNDLVKQLLNKDFKNLNFTVYNFIDGNGYVKEMSVIRNEKLDIEDFSFIVFDVPTEQRSEIKSNNYDTIKKYNEFKYYVEKECQQTPQLCIFIMKELGVVIAVKPKLLDINTIDFK